MLLLSVVGSSLFIYFIIKFYQSQQRSLQIYFWPGLAIKLVGGVSLGFIYTYYYSVGDTFGYFKDAQKVVELFFFNPGEYLKFLLLGNETYPIAQELINVQERSLFLVKILSMVSLFAFNNYYIISFYLSILSFLGSWYLFVKINLNYKQVVVASGVAFLALPSFIFWSSGVIKESLASGTIMFLSGLFLLLIKRQKLRYWEWIIGILSLFILWNLKYYWAALFIPAALTSLIVIRYLKNLVLGKSRLIELLIWLITFSCLILVASALHPNFYLSRLFSVIVENHNAYALVSGNKPFIHFTSLEPTWISMLLNSPWALISGLFRPFIFEASTPFQMIIGLENLVLLILAIYNLIFITQFWNSRDRLLIFGLIIYILLLAILLTLSTPNFGTLSRYRVGFLPFLFFLLLCYPASRFAKIFKLTLP